MHCNTPSQDPEHQSWFLVEVYEVTEGAAINQSAKFANITLLESDVTRGHLVYFAVGSRLPAVHLKSTQLSLQVQRDITTESITVQYLMEVRERDMTNHTQNNNNNNNINNV